MKIIETAFRWGMCAVWFITGMSHAWNIPRFSWHILEYGVVESRLAIVLAPLLSSTHLMLGALFLSGERLRFAVLLSIMLLTGYGIIGATAVTRGLQISCGCLGLNSPSISSTHVAFNFALAFGLAVYLRFICLKTWTGTDSVK
jgi:hypothetical protein